MKNLQHNIHCVSGIYKITNIINNKIYIGSSKNIYYRGKGHLSDCRKNKKQNPILQNAFNKYGEDNFITEILEETTNLLEREEYWIKLLNPEYNCMLINIQRPVITESMRKKISNTLKNNYKNGFKNSSMKAIEVYDLNCKFIAEFESITEATKFCKVNYSGISRVVKGIHKQCKGYIFRMKGGNKEITYSNVNKPKAKLYKPVLIYDLETTSQIMLPSQKEAKLFFNSSSVIYNIRNFSKYNNRYIITKLPLNSVNC